LDEATHNCSLAAATAFAQSSDRLPVTDAQKIVDALRAGPEFITKDATLLDWPSGPGGEYRFFVKASTNGPVSRVFPGLVETVFSRNGPERDCLFDR
jgi:hypothetical protein